MQFFFFKKFRIYYKIYIIQSKDYMRCNEFELHVYQLGIYYKSYKVNEIPGLYSENDYHAQKDSFAYKN